MRLKRSYKPCGTSAGGFQKEKVAYCIRWCPMHKFRCTCSESLSTLSYPIPFYATLSYPIPSNPIMFYLIPTYFILSYPITTYPIPSYPILFYRSYPAFGPFLPNNRAFLQGRKNVFSETSRKFRYFLGKIEGNYTLSSLL